MAPRKRFCPSHFNSRPHEEVDNPAFASFAELLTISTHDLTKRSTLPGVRYAVFHVVISTHDLTKRSTFTPRNTDSTIEFQLTTSRRGRLSVRGGSCCRGRISTHDLTKRSTAKLHILFLTFAFIISTLHK